MSQLAFDLASDRTRQKELGAFYTPAPIAECLVRWAVREQADLVLDPSFGGRVFLRTAWQRLLELGASESCVDRQILGCELDEAAFSEGLADDRTGRAVLRRLDFLQTVPGEDLPQVDAVVGNPPYVRYQGFNSTGTAGHDLASRAGVKLTRLASSWAPFVVHGTSFVARGGRMALVLPAEILHAQYAREVLNFLRRSFASVTLVLFEDRVFPGALEEVVLLFAEGRGLSATTQVRVVEARDVAGLDLAHLTRVKPDAAEVDSDELSLLAQLLRPNTRALFQSVVARPAVCTMGQVASIDIGAVTGGNNYFVVARSEPRVPRRFRRLAVTKAAYIPGARVTKAQLEELGKSGKPVDLLSVDRNLPAEALEDLSDYIAAGEAEGIQHRFKCRARSPWWSVPVPRHGVPDGFLTYCSSEHPRMVVNDARALHTNTVHGVSMVDGYDIRDLVSGFVNSLTLLSAELTGRSYGGGVLKLEPTEAEAVCLPAAIGLARNRLDTIDDLLRRRDLDAVLDIVDPIVLGPSGVDLSPDEIHALRDAAAKLRGRRRARGREPRA